MDDKESILKKVETGIKDAARAVEDFADEVAAPEEPVGDRSPRCPRRRNLRPRGRLSTT